MRLTPLSPLRLLAIAMLGGSFVLQSGCVAQKSKSSTEPQPWTRHTIDPASPDEGRRGADGVRLADVNGDGWLDIATGWEEGGTIRLCINPGPGAARQPWPAVTVGRVRSPEDAVPVDLDGDGAFDVISCCEGRTQRVYVHWAPAAPGLYRDPTAWITQPFPDTPAYHQWMYALPMTITDNVDLVIAGKSRAVVGWLQAPPDPRDLEAWVFHPICNAGWIMSLAKLDVDGDGDGDLVISDRKGGQAGVWWLENPGRVAACDATTRGWQRHLIGGKGTEVMFLDLEDIDGDGQTDVAVATRSGKVLVIYRQPASEGEPPAWRTEEIDNPFAVTGGKAVAIGDLDGDRRPDLVHTANTSVGQNDTDRPIGVAWLRNRVVGGARRWDAAAVSDTTGIKFDRIELVDLDADGDLDILTCEERENLGVFWYENPAPAPLPSRP